MAKEENNSFDLSATCISDTVRGMRLIDMTKDDMIKSATEQYLANIDPSSIFSAEELKSDLLNIVHKFILEHNKMPNCQKWRGSEYLYPEQIAMIMQHTCYIKKINLSGRETKRESEYMLLAIYMPDGENEGIYIAEERILRNIVRKYNNSIKDAELKQIIGYLADNSEIVRRCEDPNLIAVKNGIFDFKQKRLMSFTPEIVFTTKCKVDYSPWATNPIIHNDIDGTDWDVESWLEQMFDYDPDIVETIWQILSAIVRPNVKWGKCAMFLSTRGNNGKGTLCELMRNLVGHDSYVALKIADFGKDFLLEPLIHASAVITDENDVGKFVDESGNFKSAITGDALEINRKHRTPVAFQYQGFIVQCINAMPQFKDKSESLYRRQLIIEFKKSYTGRERKYIKNDYLKRKDVLEYVLHRVLNMNHYEITEPQSCKDILEKFKIFNEPVRDFLDEILQETVLDFLPNSLLWDLYKQWSFKNNPDGSKQKRNKFYEDVKDVMADDPEWIYEDSPSDVSKLLDVEEPLIEEYKLVEWQQDLMICTKRINQKKRNTKHRGYRRKTPKFTNTVTTFTTVTKTQTCITYPMN